MTLATLLRHIDRGLTTYDTATGTAHTATGETIPGGMVRYAFAASLIRFAGPAGGQMLWLGLTEDLGLAEVRRMDAVAA